MCSLLTDLSLHVPTVSHRPSTYGLILSQSYSMYKSVKYQIRNSYDHVTQNTVKKNNM